MAKDIGAADGPAGAADGALTIPVIDSLPAWSQALRWGFELAFARGARCITCVDHQFDDWPLDDPALLQRLTQWLRLPQRRLVLLAADYAGVPRRLPRFSAWRRDWSHAVQPWQACAEMAPHLPSLLLDDQNLSVHLADPVHGRGRAELQARSAVLWREQVQAVLQRSEPGFPVQTLGL